MTARSITPSRTRTQSRIWPRQLSDHPRASPPLHAQSARHSGRVRTVAAVRGRRANQVACVRHLVHAQHDAREDVALGARASDERQPARSRRAGGCGGCPDRCPTPSPPRPWRRRPRPPRASAPLSFPGGRAACRSRSPGARAPTLPSRRRPRWPPRRPVVRTSAVPRSLRARRSPGRTGCRRARPTDASAAPRCGSRSPPSRCSRCPSRRCLRCRAGAS